jgi:hypothetical protein
MGTTWALHGYGIGTAWARHGMCELALSVKSVSVQMKIEILNIMINKSTVDQ